VQKLCETDETKYIFRHTEEERAERIPSLVISSVTTSLIHKTESSQLLLIYLKLIETILF